MSGCGPTRNLRWSDQSGYTLVEFLAVAVILILLATIPLPIFLNATDTAREARSAKELRTIEGALEVYQAERGHYPDSLNQLVEHGYLKHTAFESPWSSQGYKVFYFYAVDILGDDRARAFALGDPGGNCFTVGKTKKVRLSKTQPLPCGQNPSGPTPSYIMGKDHDDFWYLADEEGNAFVEPLYLTNYRPDIRTNR